MSSHGARAAGRARARKREAEETPEFPDSEHESVEPSPLNCVAAELEAWRAALDRASAGKVVRGTIAEAARELGVKDSTFRYHLGQYAKTGVVHRTDHGPAPVLTYEGDDALAEWVKTQGREFRPPTIPLVKAMAKKLARANGIDDATVGGESWWAGFRARHPDLSVRTPQEVDNARISAPTTANLTEFYDNLEWAYAFYFPDGSPEGKRIFNMDETMLSAKNTRVKVRDSSRTLQRVPPYVTPLHFTHYLRRWSARRGSLSPSARACRAGTAPLLCAAMRWASSSPPPSFTRA